MWLGPPKTPASARTITLPPFLVGLLRDHLDDQDSDVVFASPRRCWLRRSDFDRRVFRPAVDGNLQWPEAGLAAGRPVRRSCCGWIEVEVRYRRSACCGSLPDRKARSILQKSSTAGF